jgi:hypothetical protein
MSSLGTAQEKEDIFSKKNLRKHKIILATYLGI